MSFSSIKYFFAIFTIALLAACGGGEGGEGGNEAGESGGHEGEGGGEGGGNEGASIPFVSSGQSLGQYASLVLFSDESYAGLLNDTEIAVRFNPDTLRFVGRLRNEASVAVCDVRPSVELDGYYTVDRFMPDRNMFSVVGLRPYDTAEFEFQLTDDVTFNEWVVKVETFGCSSAPSGSGGEGGEGGGEHGGGGDGDGGGEGGDEGGNEGGNEGGGNANEDDPTIPIADIASGTFRNADYSFLFDMEEMAFRGTVMNPTTQPICGLKTEIHMGIGGAQVVELGPTIPFDLPAGEIVKVVMTAPAYLPDMYSVHPESIDCP
ncbi:MAG: hypothetical protein OXG25_10470 [Gammaproteobacteria bacterium]|nr:hypothetical protein [Gammaproteobacteria bacterium]